MVEMSSLGLWDHIRLARRTTSMYWPIRRLASVLLGLLFAVLTAIFASSWLPMAGSQVPGQGRGSLGLRFLADKQGPGGTVILLNNCDASDMPEGAPAHKYIPDSEDCEINGDDDRKQLEPIYIQRFATAGSVT